LLFPLFPCAPTLSVVLHVVREPFLTRCSKTAVTWLEGLSRMFRFGVLYLRSGQEARCFFKPGVSIFSTPTQRITRLGSSADSKRCLSIPNCLAHIAMTTHCTMIQKML